ncbi:MAG: hypothetical protein AB7F86_02530, partial [Bdellovibrionales bacterium]
MDKNGKYWRLSWILLGIVALYDIFPYLFHQKEFAHRDIVYVYAPIRSWFAEQLRHGIYPFWDPFMGLGRLADAWTTIPVDLL